jgi:hypothetical protein
MRNAGRIGACGIAGVDPGSAAVRSFGESSDATVLAMRLMESTTLDPSLGVIGGRAVALQAGHSSAAVQRERGHGRQHQAGDKAT